MSRLPQAIRKSLTRALAALAGLTLLTGCQRHGPDEAGLEGIAIVDGRPVPVWKLEAELERATRQGNRPDPQEILDDLILREQLVARALRLGLDRDPGVLRSWEMAMIAKLKEQELEPALRASSTPAMELASSTPSPENPTTGSGLIRLAVLRLEASPKASAERTRALEQRLQQARVRAASLPPGTLGFGALALEYSDDDATRSRGGDLGWLAADPARYHLDPVVLTVGLAMQTPGEISPVVRGLDAFYLVRLLGRKPAEDQGFSSAAADALTVHRQQLEHRKRVEDRFIQETRQMIPVTLRSPQVAQAIARVQAQNTQPPDARLGLSAGTPTGDRE